MFSSTPTYFNSKCFSGLSLKNVYISYMMKFCHPKPRRLLQSHDHTVTFNKSHLNHFCDGFHWVSVVFQYGCTFIWIVYFLCAKLLYFQSIWNSDAKMWPPHLLLGGLGKHWQSIKPKSAIHKNTEILSNTCKTFVKTFSFCFESCLCHISKLFHVNVSPQVALRYLRVYV